MNARWDKGETIVRPSMVRPLSMPPRSRNAFGFSGGEIRMAQGRGSVVLSHGHEFDAVARTMGLPTAMERFDAQQPAKEAALNARLGPALPELKRLISAEWDAEEAADEAGGADPARNAAHIAASHAVHVALDRHGLSGQRETVLEAIREAAHANLVRAPSTGRQEGFIARANDEDGRYHTGVHETRADAIAASFAMGHHAKEVSSSIAFGGEDSGRDIQWHPRPSPPSTPPPVAALPAPMAAAVPYAFTGRDSEGLASFSTGEKPRLFTLSGGPPPERPRGSEAGRPAHIQAMQAHVARAMAGGSQTATGEALTKLYGNRLEADPGRWKPGMGVKHGITQAGRIAQWNAGYRVAEVHPGDLMATIVPTGRDTGLTTTGGDRDALGAERVYLGDLRRDTSSDRPASAGQ